MSAWCKYSNGHWGTPVRQAPCLQRREGYRVGLDSQCAEQSCLVWGKDTAETSYKDHVHLNPLFLEKPSDFFIQNSW